METPSPFVLPEPEKTAQTHSDQLVAHITQQIDAAGGWISFAEYMNLALYAPGLGYYSAGATKFGAAGDFITAPELSPLFAQCVGHQCAEIIDSLGSAVILELGAGSGRMAGGILSILEQIGTLPERYFILEVSADLRQRQRATLEASVPAHSERIEWLDRLPADGLRGVIVANEVMDALPFERFRIDRTATPNVRRLGVTVHAGRFGWADVAANDDLTRAVAEIEEVVGVLPDRYESEVCLGLQPWLASLARELESGAMLLIDYGLPRRSFYLPERANGTLMCHYRHRAHDDPFRYVGLQDITAWVDFTAVAEAASATGLNVAGFTNQASFLIGNRLGDFLTAAGESQMARIQLAQQMKTLTFPGEMGESFKAMALTRDLEIALSGFSVRDDRHTL